jgi:YD repeat-containing protein
MTTLFTETTFIQAMTLDTSTVYFYSAEEVSIIKVEIDGPERICDQAVHDTHGFTVTITPSAFVSGSIVAVINDTATATFEDGTTSKTITTSPFTDKLKGVMAGEKATIRVTTPNGCVTEHDFAVIGLTALQYHNANCPDSPHSILDSTEGDGNIAPTNGLDLMQIETTNGTRVAVSYDLAWLPTSWINDFRWEFDPAVHWESGADVFISSGVPVTNAWIYPGAGATREHSLLAWFDCDPDSTRAVDEPKRKVPGTVAFFKDITTCNEEGDPTLITSPGSYLLARMETVEPSDRIILWEVVKATPENDGDPVPTYTLANTNNTEHTVELHIPADSHSGTITLRGRDSRHECVAEEIDIKVGCASCSDSCPAGGSVRVLPGSINVHIDLGTLRGGGSAGELRLKMNGDETSPLGDLLMAPIRRVDLRDGYKIIESRFGDIKENVSIISEDHDNVRIEMGLFTYRLKRSQNPAELLKVTRSGFGNDKVYIGSRNEADGKTTWAVTHENRIERLTRYLENQFIIEDREIAYTAGGIASKIRNRYITIDSRKLLIESITDPDGKALTETIDYHTNPADASYLKVKKRTNSDGTFTTDDYDDQGRALRQARGHGSETNTVRHYDYSLHTGEIQDYRTGTARTIIETTDGITNAVTYSAFVTNSANERIEISERASGPLDGFGSTNNPRTVTTYYSPANGTPAAGRAKSSLRQDESLTTYTYHKGDYSFEAPGIAGVSPQTLSNVTWTVVTQATATQPDGIAQQTTRSITVSDEFSRTLLSETYVYTGTSYERINWTFNQLNSLGQVISSINSSGQRTETTWGCCGKESEIDQQGLLTTYVYDDLDRVELMARQLGTNSIFTTYTYDAAGRRLTTLTQAGGLSQATSNTYDLAGHLISSTDAQGITTTYENGCCGLESTTIRAGLTNLTVRYPDGRTHYTEQNGIRQQTYVYGLDLSSPGHQTTTVFTGPAATNSPAWQKSTTDFLGRTIRTERPGFGGTTLITENTYNTLGQLISTQSSTADGVYAATLYQYNALGEQTLTAQDLNLNGTIDLAGPDRVTESHTSYTSHASHYYRESRSYTYPEDGSATPILTGTQRQRLTGLGQSTAHGILAAESISIDMLGNQTTQQTHIDRDAKVRVDLVSTPSSTKPSTQTTINGLLISQTSSTGQKTTYGYDALGRRIATAPIRAPAPAPPTITHLARSTGSKTPPPTAPPSPTTPPPASASPPIRLPAHQHHPQRLQPRRPANRHLGRNIPRRLRVRRLRPHDRHVHLPRHQRDHQRRRSFYPPHRSYDLVVRRRHRPVDQQALCRRPRPRLHVHPRRQARHPHLGAP